MPLTDIAIGHTKLAGKSGPSAFYILHPFEVTRGPNRGKYELLRDTSKPGEKQKNRSAHVTMSELAELFARGWMEGMGITIRMRPSDNDYPTAPPVKKLTKASILRGSEFDLMVEKFDVSQGIGTDLFDALQRIGIGR